MMRGDGDRRPAAQVKLHVVRELARKRRIAVVVDDDARVLATLSDAGFTTFAATWEARAFVQDRALDQAQQGDGRT
ncbi:MAG TPA: hypothetical protein VNQ73_11300 [Ilumatobacter sp.]|nr:hypothetical protein [Ilumatobacter sp.]